MRKVVLCLFYALCAFAIAFSLFWMALPRLALPSPAPGADSAAETPVPSGPSLARQTDIYVNLLPENDALRVKQGMAVTGDAALQEVLEDLGG